MGKSNFGGSYGGGGLGGRSPEFCLRYVNFERHISYLSEYVKKAELGFRGEIRTLDLGIWELSVYK